MSSFALSVPGFRLGVHSYKRRRHDEEQQDTEAPSPSSHPDSDTETQFSSRSRLPSEAINPLSHSPGTLHQLAVAGLSPEDELPSRLHPGFPHKPIPSVSLRRRRSERRKKSFSRGLATNSSDGGASGSETDATITAISQRQHGRGDGGGERADEERYYSARMRHLNNMTAIMHRCLRDGDIARAKRALGLLMQTRDVDLRIDNLWVVGLEILMRDGEKEVVHERKKKTPLSSSHKNTLAYSYATSSSSSSSSDTDEDWDNPQATDEEAEEEDDDAPAQKPPKRWGTAANTLQARTYLEALIQQHPYDAHRPHLTSAVDFWPALFGIDIYNLDAEFQSALHQIYVEHGFPSSSSSSSFNPSSNERDNDDDDDPDSMDIDDDDNHNDHNNNNDDDDERSNQPRHTATTALRATTQLRALEIATRLDTVLENPPYNTHAELLRQRAHLSLFIADLHLPWRLVERYNNNNNNTTQSSSSSSSVLLQGGEAITNSHHRRLLREHAKTPEDRVALARRRKEQRVARAFFARVVGAKGWLEDWVLRFLDEEGEEGEGI